MSLKAGDKVTRIFGAVGSSFDSDFNYQQEYEVESARDGYVYIVGKHSAYSDELFNRVTTKASNPKDVIGDTKLDYSVIPNTLLAFAATSFMEGALKYGKFNWRHVGVRSTVYTSALERHLQKYISGEFTDPETGVPHLASVIACAGIILDAGAHGKLTDDRPDESVESVRTISDCQLIQQGLKKLHSDKSPVHYVRSRDVSSN